MPAVQWFRNAPVKLLNKEVDWNSDTIKGTLHTAAYTPNLDTHDYVDDLTNELATAAGYTAGGATLPTPTMAFTAANSWGTSWAAATAYALDKVVRPTTGNGFLYRAAVAGTSHASTEPTWPTVIGTTVVDNGVTWECVGKGIVVLDADDLVWSGSNTFGPYRYLVLSDRTPGTAATQPLLFLVDFGSNQTAQGGAVTEQWDAQGIAHIFVP